MIDGAAAPPSQAPAASRAEVVCLAIIYNENLNLHSFERLVAVGARHYYIDRAVVRHAEGDGVLHERLLGDERQRMAGKGGDGGCGG
jgi:hypothetical protein